MYGVRVKPSSHQHTKHISHKRALQLVALLQKMTCILRHPMGLRHPACECLVLAEISRLLQILGLFCKRAQ